MEYIETPNYKTMNKYSSYKKLPNILLGESEGDAKQKIFGEEYK